MARPRFKGQGFTNPLSPLGLNAESRHRVNPQLSGAFMSNETHFAETVNGNQVFNVAQVGTKVAGRAGARAAAPAQPAAAALGATAAATQSPAVRGSNRFGRRRISPELRQRVGGRLVRSNDVDRMFF